MSSTSLSSGKNVCYLQRTGLHWFLLALTASGNIVYSSITGGSNRKVLPPEQAMQCQASLHSELRWSSTTFPLLNPEFNTLSQQVRGLSLQVSDRVVFSRSLTHIQVSPPLQTTHFHQRCRDRASVQAVHSMRVIMPVQYMCKHTKLPCGKQKKMN